jgi:hypothetical protein
MSPFNNGVKITGWKEGSCAQRIIAEEHDLASAHRCPSTYKTYKSAISAIWRKDSSGDSCKPAFFTVQIDQVTLPFGPGALLSAKKTVIVQIRSEAN